MHKKTSYFNIDLSQPVLTVGSVSFLRYFAPIHLEQLYFYNNRISLFKPMNLEGSIYLTTGKLSSDLLTETVFKNIKHTRDEVIMGAEVGEDNALVDFGEEIAVLSTDPITGAINDIGGLAIDISVNDISASGAKALGVLLTILAPEGTEDKEIETIMIDAGKAAKRLDIQIMGGHTEITDAVNKIVVSTTALGKMKKEQMLQKENIKTGDKILVTKSIGIEGVSILLNDYEDYFRDKMDKSMIQKGKKYGDLISVKKEGLLGGKMQVHYMHDITEGGLFGAVWEAHKAIDKGIKIDRKSIPITPVTKTVTDLLDINPMRLISSGSMLIIGAGKTIENLKKKLHKENIDSSIIGEVVEEGVWIEENDQKETITPPEGDDLYKALHKLRSKTKL